MKKTILFLTIQIFVLSIAFAQTKTISGTVLDKETSGPLAGATVTGASNQVTLTDADGKFTLTVNDALKNLTFSYSGYSTQILAIPKNGTIKVIMTPESQSSDPVVVVGYGTLKKSSVTGSVAKLKVEKLDQTPVTRLDQALQGKMAGVSVQNISSEAGSDPKVLVRGISSINAGQSPLVVVDGHPVPDGLAFVNMSDVESVEVLKDAASAAIYGSRGATGVILITTKSGKAQKTKYNFKSSWGSRIPYKTYPIMTTVEYTDLLYKEAALRFADSSWTNYATAAQITAKGNLITNPEKAQYLIEKDLLNGEATDWQDAALQNGNIRTVDLNVSGGSKEFKFYVAGAYQKEDGMMIKSQYERFNLRTKIDATLNKKLKLSLNINPSYIRRERPGTSFTDFTRLTGFLPLQLNQKTLDFVRLNPVNANLRLGDFAQPRVFNDLPFSGTMPDGSMFTSTGTLAVSGSANNSPYGILQLTNFENNEYRLLNSLDLSYSIKPNLTFKVLGSAYINSAKGLDFTKSNANRQGDASRGVYTDRQFIDLLNENTLNYTKDYKNHKFSALAGFTVQRSVVKNQQIVGLNYQSDNVSTLNTALAIDQANSFNNINRIGLVSALSRVNYSYKDKYLLTASIRADGSSYFGPGNKWGVFPSVSVGWIASKEKFLENVDWISNLKFRGSYGVTGNNRIVDYAFVDQLFAANYITGAGNGSSAQGVITNASILPNPDITWERTFQYNGGIDLSILRNRINITVDMYQSKTDKLLLNQSAMAISGVPQTWNNIGQLQNRGVELELSTTNIQNKSLKWTTTANFARVRNKILALGLERQLLNIGERQDGYLSVIGGPSVQFYGFKTDGLWNSQVQINEERSKGLSSPLSGYFQPGGLKFVDIKGDKIIDLNDRTVIGNPYPDFTWGVTNTVNYKSLDVTFTFQGVQGGSVLNGDMFYNEARKYNKSFTDNRWISPANPGDGKTPYFTNGYTNAWTQSDYILQDASYASLRDIVLGYTLPARWVNKARLSNLRLYASAQNLIFITSNSYKGLNVEARSNIGAYASPLVDGYQRGAFPLNRGFLFGVEIGF